MKIDNIDKIDNIGERLKSVRQYLIMTQQQVANTTGIPVITISKIEHNKVVNSDSFIKMIQFYSNYISVDFLLAKDFRIADADRYAKSFSLNTIVKAKLELLKQQFTKDIEKSKNDFVVKITDTINLL
ncbi:helix-turn-helix domain-containing protein [Prevotella ihumii]|uniref:helix-turn-helix domain-containing protein n=1 Tax=Prevotella ihumii TaxID=1917878 RepID=UPI000980B48D|nr:helix-turn-helix transcriptional regulator [Prevotella ihumii]